MFGTFVKELRARQRLGLREFCLEHGHDPSNWSKIEREVLAPPRDEDTLRSWAKQLGLKQGSEDWLKFFDYAAVDAGRIPEYVLKDEQLVAKLPLFFRTLSGQKPSREDLEAIRDRAQPPQSAIGTLAVWSRTTLRRFHQLCVENDALRVDDLADRFHHAVARCLTAWHNKGAARIGSGGRWMRAKRSSSILLYDAMAASDSLAHLARTDAAGA